jgi:hypothetical protein
MAGNIGTNADSLSMDFATSRPHASVRQRRPVEEEIVTHLGWRLVSRIIVSLITRSSAMFRTAIAREAGTL